MEPNKSNQRFRKSGPETRTGLVVEAGFAGFDTREPEAFCYSPADDAEIIYRKRNTVWRIHRGELDCAVKTFGNSSLARFMYAVRKSKARRSYEYATELLRRGIATPAPVGYAEIRGHFNLLKASCYACEYEETMPLRDGISTRGEECIKAFAGFVAKLHEAGIRHDDLNNSNVRVRIHNDSYFEFSLIDLNRMKIYPKGKPVPLKRSYLNTFRFCGEGEQYEYFAKAYIEARHLPHSEFRHMIDRKSKFEIHFWRRKRILHAIRDFFLLRFLRK